jgi:hypothetical protein
MLLAATAKSGKVQNGCTFKQSSATQKQPWVDNHTERMAHRQAALCSCRASIIFYKCPHWLWVLSSLLINGYLR